MVYTSPYASAASDDISLERSPSLMSRSSGASTPPPVTPALPSTGSFSTTTASSSSSSWNPSKSGSANTHEKGIFSYQSKYLNRTSSIQSINGIAQLPRATTVQSGLGLSSKYASSSNLGGAGATAAPAAQHASTAASGAAAPHAGAVQREDSVTSARNKRTTWAPGHRIAGTNSISSVDDIMGRFGGRTTPTQSHPTSSPTTATFNRPSSPPAAAGPTPVSWRSSLQASRSNSSPNTHDDQNHAPSMSYRSQSAYGTSSSSASASASSYPDSTRPLSPTSLSTARSANHQHLAPSAPLESEIMRHSFSAGTHKPKQPSLNLGAVSDLSHSSVSYLRNFREYAVQGGSAGSGTASSESGSNGGVERMFTVRGGPNKHRRTQTLPQLGGGYDKDGRPPSPEKSTMSRSKTGKLNLHGLDRLSERSDGSNEGAPSANIGLGVPSSPTKKSSQGRRMASDAGEDETGAIVIPGITVGSDSVAGMTGRLRLARQPTQTRYGNLPSATAKAMDNQRQNLQAYEYLCHVSEAKEWLVSCLSAHPLSPSMNTRSPDLASPTFSPVQNGQDGDDDDPSGLSNKSVVELEEALRNGVALARLARAFMGDKAVPRIFTVSATPHYISTEAGMTRYTV